MELRDLKSYNILKEKDPLLAGQVEAIYKLTYETINGIARFYDNYTMHDMNHGLRVAAYMEKLAFGLGDDLYSNINKYNALELALIILTAVLHDIGMFIRPEDEIAIKRNEIKYTNSLTYDGVLKVSGNENEAIKEIIRITHAARINEFINYSFNGQTISQILMINGNYTYADDIASICRSHGEDYTYIKTLRKEITKGNYTYNPQFIAVLLRIADYLDLDKQRTPILWYSMMGINGFSREEWEKHFIIQNERKLRKYIDNKLQIYFDGKSSNAKIHRKYLKYIDELRTELENADELLNTIDANKKYTLNVSTKLDDCVQTENFKYSNLRLTLDYSAITDLLMGKNIYGDSKLGLRELIQNSIDACKLMKEIKGNDPDIPDPSIYVLCSKKNNYVKIKDTGIGMTLDIVKKHFLNVGKSYYKSHEYLHKNYAYEPIGQYGIGFLACFLLSDNVIVKTRYYKSNEINQIELEKNSEYVVTNTEIPTYFFGTEIKLEYNKFFDVFENEDILIEFMEQYFYTSIPIYIKNEDASDATIKIVNSCGKIINTLLEKSSKTKYDEIICENYSDVINGCLKIKNLSRIKSPNIFKIPSKTYLFNSQSKKFELIEQGTNLDSGYYHSIKYSTISMEDYTKITITKKSNARKRNEIFALSKNNSQDALLLINDKESIDMMGFIVSKRQININGVSIETILTESKLQYYKELIFDYDCIDNIFIKGDIYTNLHDCIIDGFYHSYRLGDFRNKREFFFYNKEIFISEFRGIDCSLPYEFEVIGFINNTGKYIKLDVSRNSVISGYYQLQNEISNILLKFIKNKFTLENSLIAIINEMIEYNSKINNDTK